MRLGRILFLVSLLLLASAGAAHALTISNSDVFALTRSETVSWKTNVTLTLSSMAVTANTLVLDGVTYDVRPYSGSATVIFTRWGADIRELTILRTPSAVATVNVSNPHGISILGYHNLSHISTCANTTSTCSWTLNDTTESRFRILLDPLGEIVESPETAPTPPAAAAPPPAEAPSSGASEIGQAISDFVESIPSPAKTFPRFSLFQWVAFLAGLVLFFGAFAITARVLPPFLHVPGPPRAKLVTGLIVLVVVYLSTPVP